MMACQLTRLFCAANLPEILHLGYRIHKMRTHNARNTRTRTSKAHIYIHTYKDARTLPIQLRISYVPSHHLHAHLNLAASTRSHECVLFCSVY